MHITFTENLYDQDGDIYNHGIFLFIDDTVILKVKDADEIGLMIKNLQDIQNELTTS